MCGIAKSMGFEKQDIELIDYEKAKNYTARIRRDGKYRAVIFGSIPHNTMDKDCYSSYLLKLKQTEGMPFVADARRKSGGLKVTKTSFKCALTDVYEYLKQKKRN